MPVSSANMPAPSMGIDAISPAGAMRADRCVYAWNAIPDELGLRARSGFDEWLSGLTGGATGEVRSMMAFAGAAAASSGDRLFATTATGIWNVTAYGGPPSQIAVFPTVSGDSGYGVSRGCVTAAGHFLAYCDEENGYYLYSESSASWSKVVGGAGPTEINGVDPSKLVFVTTHKGRVWFAERDTANLWYLPAGAIYGTAVKFAVGALLPHGGTVVGVWSWSYDGGAGPDDLLVIVGSGGDVVVYRGTDPASASTWEVKGSWYTGGVPRGRNIAMDSGGELLLLTLIGVLPLSRLVLGSDPQDRKIYVTRWVDPIFSALAAQRGTLRGWALYLHPLDRAILVAIPTVGGSPTEQIAISTVTGAATRWRGLPVFSAATWDGLLFFGTADGRVCRTINWLDDGAPVEASVLTAYQTLGDQRWKQIQTIRPIFVGGAANIASTTVARYGYATDEPAGPSGVGGGGPSAWGSAVWGVSKWGPDYLTTAPIRGASGMGREAAVAVRWNAIARSTLVGVDVTFTTGGPL